MLNKLKSTMVLLLLAGFFIFLVPSPAQADIFSNNRADNGNVKAFFSSSVDKYGYTTIYRTAQDRWRGISNRISLNRTLYTDNYPDFYNISGTRRKSSTGGILLGQAVPHNTAGSEIGANSNWRYVVITLYHNNYEDLKMTTNQRIATAVHEVGHSLKLAHPGSQVPLNGRASIMITGQKSGTYPQGYDQVELQRKWGN